MYFLSGVDVTYAMYYNNHYLCFISYFIFLFAFLFSCVTAL